jgi:hypothetical protein
MFKDTEVTVTVENCTGCNTGIELSYADLEALEDSNVEVEFDGLSINGDRALTCTAHYIIKYEGWFNCPFCNHREVCIGQTEYDEEASI